MAPDFWISEGEGSTTVSAPWIQRSAQVLAWLG